jgi:hypothetical protein
VDVVLPLAIIFAISFGCFYWVTHVFFASLVLVGILVVLAGIFGIVTHGWAIVALMFFPHVWIPVVILGAVLGWIVRRNVAPEAKEKSQ